MAKNYWNGSSAHGVLLANAFKSADMTANHLASVWISWVDTCRQKPTINWEWFERGVFLTYPWSNWPLNVSNVWQICRSVRSYQKSSRSWKRSSPAHRTHESSGFLLGLGQNYYISLQYWRPIVARPPASLPKLLEVAPLFAVNF